MATTLLIESFADINIVERSTLDAAADSGATTLTLVSTQGFTADQDIFVGTPAKDGCEAASIESVDSDTQLTLKSGIGLSHTRFEPVIGAVGGSARIYRAANVDGSVPADDSFNVLATRTLDADQQSTYYTDSSGSSSYWYKSTYYNATAATETALAAATAARGDDYGHYAGLSEIRAEAGFTNAVNLRDSMVDQQRRAAETEINDSLAAVYTVPFIKPVPDTIHTLTIQLAAGLLLAAAYGEDYPAAVQKLKDARSRITAMQTQTSVLTDYNGDPLTSAELVDYFPDDEAPRAFERGMRF